MFQRKNVTASYEASNLLDVFLLRNDIFTCLHRTSTRSIPIEVSFNLTMFKSLSTDFEKAGHPQPDLNLASDLKFKLIYTFKKKISFNR